MFFVISVAWAGVARPCSWRCRCWHLADVDGAADQCPFTGVKQTSQFDGAMSAFDPKQTSRAFLGFRFLSERAAQWLDLRTGSALLAQQPREFGRRGISALANEANILEMAHKVAAKIKDIPVADRRDLLSGRRCWKGCFADSLRPWVRTAERRNASKPRPKAVADAAKVVAIWNARQARRAGAVVLPDD